MRHFAFGYSQGLKAARDAPSTLLATLRAPEVYSDGEEPKGAPPPLAGPQGEDTVDKPLNELYSPLRSRENRVYRVCPSLV